MRRVWIALSSAAILMLVMPQSWAGPVFRIGEGGESWTSAMQSGKVFAAGQMVAAEEEYYGSSGQPFVYSVPTLVPDVMASDGQEEHTSLQMAWAAATSSDALSVAAWRFAYQDDPDLTGTLIKFSLLPPANILGVSLTLIDANGFTRGWFLGPLMPPQPPPPPVWGNFTIDPSLVGPQGPFTGFVGNPLFDIKSVVGIQLDEAGRILALPVPSPPVPVPGAPLWNAWNHLEVVPEPSTLTALGIGVLALVGWAARRRRT